MLKFYSALIILLMAGVQTFAQVDARMFRTPDVSETHIAFVYAGDIWIVDKNGGVANKLSSPDGQERFPRFSPDGSMIAFNGNYDGNMDIYVMPTMGGAPKQLTYHGYPDFLIDWSPDGNELLYSSSKKSGRQRFDQFYLISKDGGLSSQMPMAHAEYGSLSPDGKKIAFTDKTRLHRTWKRYRGGTAANIWNFDLETMDAELIISSNANDEMPMYHGDKIYFLSDRGPASRFNIWVYDIASKATTQVTSFTDFDVHYPGIGPSDMVFEAGGKLYLLNLASGEYNEVNVQVVTDQFSLTERSEKVGNLASNGAISPKGNRAIVEARGELFSLPAKDGYVKNLTNTSGIAERFPAWSPNGKYVAYFSDRSGEYELTLMDLENSSETKVTNLGTGFKYHLYWSPDSKKLAFIDQAMKIKVFDRTTNQVKDVDQGKFMYQGSLNFFYVSWSGDSRWLAYTRGNNNRNRSVFLYDNNSGISHQVTTDFYNEAAAVFDPDGKYLYVLTNRHFAPEYSDYDNSFVYPNSTQIGAIALRKDVKSPLAPKNDEVSIEKEKSSESSSEKGKKGKKGKEEDNGEAKVKPVNIDLDGFESRLVILPVKPGNFGKIAATPGKVLFHHAPNTGSNDEARPLKYFDLKEREEKTILGDINSFEVSADHKKIMVRKGRSMAIVKVAASQKMENQLPLGDMEMMVDPRSEWKQIFSDVWRFQRDYFYDENMHGVDWNEMRTRYGNLIDDCFTRWDVNFVIGELIGELNASHTYRGGGDQETGLRRNTGYLGIDWEISEGAYRIKRIVRPADWEVEVRSPLDMPGVNVKEGDYILSVNGISLDVSKEPYAAFKGLGGKTVELMVNSSPSKSGARKVMVETMRNESRLRHLEWQESKRKRVEEATGGKAGYVYVRSTGFDGQNELARQFYGQWNKPAMVIDERFNSGGQIPDRFIELLNRKPLAFWAVRDGDDWQWPPIANFGPMVMLINGWSGSGGDAFPDYFRKTGLGPLVGTRTWGGLIGITGAPQLIDGGIVTVPTFRMYDPDGQWFKEGYGVDPDIEVIEDPSQLAKGVDPQLERAIEEVMKQFNASDAFKTPDRPAYETR